jgi:hypothetical protein
LVYVTFGTLFNANLDLFRLALTALADQPVDVVLTIGRDQDPDALAPPPRTRASSSSSRRQNFCRRAARSCITEAPGRPSARSRTVCRK